MIELLSKIIFLEYTLFVQLIQLFRCLSCWGPKIVYIYIYIFSVYIWEARMWHRRCRTRVRRGGTRRRAGDAAALASGRVRPRGSHVGFFDARRREPILADSGLNRPVSAETADSGRNSKKKKNPERTVY